MREQAGEEFHIPFDAVYGFGSYRMDRQLENEIFFVRLVSSGVLIDFLFYVYAPCLQHSVETGIFMGDFFQQQLFAAPNDGSFVFRFVPGEKCQWDLSGAGLLR